jgi:two-component SAPR family response regulator
MKQKEELKSIPVLLHTTVDLEAIRKKGINYIVKPVTKNELLSAVEKVFKARE